MTGTTAEPVWLSVTQVRMLHAESVDLFGGSPGIRDLGMLESALARAVNKWHYDRTDSLFELSASYAFGTARNHAFVDGNKRTALLAIRSFLFRNGYEFSPDEVDTVTMIERLADGQVDEELLSAWIDENSRDRE